MTEKYEPDYREILCRTNTALFVCSGSPECSIIHVSGNVRSIFGYRTEYFSSGNVGFYSLIHDEDVDNLKREFSGYLDNKNITDIVLHPYRIVTPNGGQKWVEDRTLIKRDSSGNVLLFECILTEITSYRNFEDKLKYRIGFEKLISSISAGFLNIPEGNGGVEFHDILKKIGEYAGVDCCYMFLFNPDIPELKSCYSWFSEGMSDCMNEAGSFLLNSFRWWMEKLKRLENIYISSMDSLPDEARREKEFFVKNEIKSILAVPLVFEKSPIGFLSFNSVRKIKKWAVEDIILLKTVGNIIVHAIQRDIWNKKLISSKESARAADRAKSEFLANMSHELRTPLNGIIGMGNLIRDTDLSEKQAYFLEMLLYSAETLFRIINDLLDFSRIDTGKVVLRPEKFNLKERINLAAEDLLLAAQKKNLSLKIEFEGDFTSFYGDRVRIGQIFLNLVTNAIKFSDSGEIRVFIKLDKTLKINITDTGVGISEDKMGSLFEVFHQGEDTYTKTHSGIGLGLAIVKQLVDLMKGTITVNSKVNIGSTFVVELPLIEENNGLSGGSKKPEAEKEKENILNRKVKLLIAEDELINRIYIKNLLANQGWDVEEAGNGLEVLEKFQKEKYDVVIMDLSMPGMGGLEAAGKVREIEEKSGGFTPIIALTAHAYQEDIEKCYKAGMNEYVSKPIDEAALIHTIRKLISPAKAPA